MLKPLMDAETIMTLDLEGKVLSVEAPEIPGMENMGMGKEEMEQSVRELSELMANKVVTQGESWTALSQLPTGGMTKEPVSVKYTMTFIGMSEKEGRELAKVKIAGSIQSEDENLKVTSKELSGMLFFDPEIGQPREMTITMDLEIGLPEGAIIAEGAAGKMPMKMKTVSKLVEIK